ncbi:MAG TPA: tetratricopeptide repeat protein [Pyrinomonadaceae bacterium]|nr:tetratricopeptide repeat protein [Pyrinomonadaceae bacterium]
MSPVKSDQLKMIDLRAPLLRVLLVVPVALALVGSWYAGRWYVGNVIADHAPNLESGSIEMARMTTQLAPDDPLTHWTVASLEKQALAPDQVGETLGEFERAVSLSPYDYRLWVDLGRTREQAGDREGGEKALRRAVELAPFYAEPRWLLGNLLLRSGRIDEAFAELQRSAETNPLLRPQIFNMASYVFGGDVQAISRAVGNSAASRADLASYLMSQKRLDDALGQWATLSAADKMEQRPTGVSLMRALLQAKRFHAAFELFRGIDRQTPSRIQVGQVLNGGFEEDIGGSSDNPFEWHIRSAAQAQIGIDERYRRSGNRSLRIRFQAPGGLNFNNINQLIAVEPSTEYRLEYYVRTAELKSAATPVILIRDGLDGAVLAASDPLPAGTSDWQTLTLDFKTTPKTEAIMIDTKLSACESDAPCPIFGIVWYDDFNLQRGGTNAGPQGRRESASGAQNHDAR